MFKILLTNFFLGGGLQTADIILFNSQGVRPNFRLIYRVLGAPGRELPSPPSSPSPINIFQNPTAPAEAPFFNISPLPRGVGGISPLTKCVFADYFRSSSRFWNKLSKRNT